MKYKVGDTVTIKDDGNRNQSDHGFKKYEIAKLKRDVAWIKNGVKELTTAELEKRQHYFFVYFNQIDKRRNTDFAKTFPELSIWWADCYNMTKRENK